MTRGQGPSGAVVFAELRSAWTGEGARPHTSSVQNSSAFLERDVFLRVGWANIVGARPNQSVVVELFDDVRGPAATRETAKMGVNRSTSIPSVW